MFNSKPRFLSLLFTLSLSLTIFLSNVTATMAIPWEELIFRGIQIIQLSNISDRQEVEIGGQIRQQLLSEGKIKLYQDRQLSRYVNEIGQRLVAVSGRSDIPYNFEVVENRQVNAFATMGGYIYLHTGLITTASNEAELASVIAHEIAHVVAKHSQGQMRQRAVTQGLLSAAGLDRTNAIQLGVNLAVDLPKSREDEYEADNLGLQILKRAGYAPQAMVDFMRKLSEMSGNTPSILSTHPNSRERVISLQRQVSRETGYQGDGTDEREYRYRVGRLFGNNSNQQFNRNNNRYRESDRYDERNRYSSPNQRRQNSDRPNTDYNQRRYPSKSRPSNY